MLKHLLYDYAAEGLTSDVNYNPYGGNSSNTDLQNIVEHSLSLAQKNKTNICEKKLHILKNSEVMGSDEWNDIHVIDTLNKSTVFKKVIVSYKENLDLINNPLEYFSNMSSSSGDLTKAIMQSIMLFEGNEGISSLRTSLLNIQYGLCDLKWVECKKLYNILLYSAPFFLVSQNPDLVIHAPFEFLSNQLYSLSYYTDYTSLSFFMKLQATLEKSLPEMSYLRDLYTMSQYTVFKIGLYFFRRRNLIPIGGLYILRLSAPILLDLSLPTREGVSIVNSSPTTDQVSSRSKATDRLEFEICTLFSS